MANQITPNPSVPSQVVQEVKFPQFVNNLGIIPTSYKDSMSYYECLAWLCKYLEETVIPTVNQNGSAVQELQGLYIELQDYVIHYFDNLDVSEEINSKLDEMAENGSLYTIIERFTSPITNALNARIDLLSDEINALSISPLVASSTAGMTDTNRIYVNTTDGKWYYYNGSAWTIGGTYQSTMDSVDKTLTQSDVAPDSKIVGEKLQEKNFDINYISGYKIIQNPIKYDVNSQTYVSDVGVTENGLTFTVASGQTVKGVVSHTLPLIRGNTYTIKFDVDLSDNENAIKFYYNGGPGTLNKNITGHDSISSTFTRALTAGADGALLFMIDNDTENSVTVSISNLILFEGTVSTLTTLKQLSDSYNSKTIEENLVNGVDFSTTNSGTVTTNIPVTAGNTYKINVISNSNIINFFSSADTSITVLRVTSPGIYYFTPTVSGYLSTFAYNVGSFSASAKIYLLKFTDTLYVKPDGNDSNNGLSPDTPLATFQKAINLGAKHILAFRGKYHQSIKLVGNGEELSIKPYNNNSFAENVPDRPLIEIYNGTELLSLSSDDTYTTLLSQNFDGNNAWNAVFITQTLPPSTSGYRGYNNAGLWQTVNSDDFSNNKRINPVLTIEECVATTGTFTWDGTKVYINPYDLENSSFIVQDDVNYGFHVENLSKLELEDVSVKFSKQANFGIKNCMDIHLQNCISQFTNVINGFQLNNSNGLLENCQAYNSRDDGFGAQDYGVTTYIDCIGNYNDDDGISHHFGERATIIGGEYAHNGKGGVASPTYGAYVNIYNVYSHHNDCGIYATNESNDHEYATRTCFASNCLITNNRIGVRGGGTTTIIGWNNVFDSNVTKSVGDYVEYTNQS